MRLNAKNRRDSILEGGSCLGPPPRLCQVRPPNPPCLHTDRSFLLVEYLEEAEAPEEKEKMVVLGSGWAAMSLVSALNLFRYDVTLVSPRNYFLFTPLLADAAVGTVSTDSVVEPVRSFAHGPGFEFVEASAQSIDHVQKVVHCTTVAGKQPVAIPYDKLVLAVGSVSHHNGLKGVTENALPLRDLHDAVRIRNSVIDCLERANSNLADEEEKKRLLHFIVVGGSAVASEAASELHDFVVDNIDHSFPELKPFFKLTVVDSKDHIHNFYDKSISQAIRRYTERPSIELMTDVSVASVAPGELFYYPKIKTKDELEATQKKTSSSSLLPEKLPFGLCVWSTGNAIHPLAQHLRAGIGGVQNNERALVTDSALRVLGVEDIFALGDCATIDQGTLLKKWADFFESSDTNNDGTIDLEEYRAMMSKLSRTYPALKAFDDSVFAKVDINHDKVLTQDEFKELMSYMDRTLTRFPATAAVAAQQGSFLADHLNKGHYDDDDEEDAKEEGSGEKKEGPIAALIAKADGRKDKEEDEEKEDGDKKDDEEEKDDDSPVFRYKHIGGYEYVGADSGMYERGSKGMAIVSGPGAVWMWRAVYFSRVMSASMRFHLILDWVHTSIFGSRPTRV